MTHSHSKFSQCGGFAAFPIFILAAILFPAGRLSGQAITGTVVGTVSDATGAVVSGAKVTAKNVATGITLSTISGSEGNYTIPNVPPGTYDISAQLTGFNTAVAPKNVVQVQQTTRVDFTLITGSTTTEVTVTAVAPLVQSTTSDLGPRGRIAPDSRPCRSMGACSSSW